MIVRCYECKSELDDRVAVRFTPKDGPALCSWSCVVVWRVKTGSC